MRKTPSVLALIGGILGLLLVVLEALPLCAYAAEIMARGVALKEVLQIFGSMKLCLFLEIPAVIWLSVGLLRRKRTVAMVIPLIIWALLTAGSGSVTVSSEGLYGGWEKIVNLLRPGLLLLLAVDILWGVRLPRLVKFIVFPVCFAVVQLMLFPARNFWLLFDMPPYVLSGVLNTVFLVLMSLATVMINDWDAQAAAEASAAYAQRLAQAAVPKVTVHDVPQPLPPEQKEPSDPCEVPQQEQRSPSDPHYVLLQERGELPEKIRYVFRFVQYDAGTCIKLGQELMAQALKTDTVRLEQSSGVKDLYLSLYSSKMKLSEHPFAKGPFLSLEIGVKYPGGRFSLKMVPDTNTLVIDAEPHIPGDTVTLWLDRLIGAAVSREHDGAKD